MIVTASPATLDLDQPGSIPPAWVLSGNPETSLRVEKGPRRELRKNGKKKKIKKPTRKWPNQKYPNPPPRRPPPPTTRVKPPPLGFKGQPKKKGERGGQNPPPGPQTLGSG